MSNRKHLLNIFGPSTAGKSTVAELLQKNVAGMYTVDFDVIKRQLSGYYWKRDSAVAREITNDTLVSVAKKGLEILALLPPPLNAEMYKPVETVAQTHGYDLVNIEITAPTEILIKRYEKRLQNIAASGSSWNVKTLDEFKDRLDQSYYRPNDALTFDSSLKSPAEIVEEIQKLLSK